MDNIHRIFMTMNEADIESSDYVAVKIDTDDELWFTQTHFAEIREGEQSAYLRLRARLRKTALGSLRPTTQERIASIARCWDMKTTVILREPIPRLFRSAC
jgi:hypothetical protein